MTDLLRRNLIEFTPSGGVLRFATKDEGVQAVANMLPTDHCPRPFDPVEYEKVAIGVLCVLDNLVGRDNQLRDVALAIFNVAHRNGDYSEMVQAAMLLEDARRLDELRKLLPDEVHLVPHDYVIIERSADFLMNAILRTN